MARGKRTGRIGYDAPTSENISLHGEVDANPFAEEASRGHGADPRARKITVVIISIVVVYLIAIIIPKDMLNEALHYSGYSSGYTFSWFVEDLQANMNGIVGVFTGHDAEIGYLETLIRYAVIALTGAGLALCGAVYQGSFRNALVSPSSMGVMSGASAGMLVWLLFYVNDSCSNVPWASNISSNVISEITATSDPVGYLISSYSLCLYSFAGCMIVAGLTLLVMALSKKNSTSGLMIIITGQVFGGLLGAATTVVRYYMTEVEGYEAKLELLNGTAVRSFYRDFTVLDIFAIIVPIIIVTIVVMRLRQRMMVLSFGNEESRSMGVDSKRTQLLVVSVSTLLTAILISFCGRIGFVGFFVPHLARRMVGPNFKYLLPASMAVGALFVMSAYLIVSCTLGPDYESMVGMFVSMGGTVVFLVQALRGAGRSSMGGPAAAGMAAGAGGQGAGRAGAGAGTGGGGGM